MCYLHAKASKGSSAQISKPLLNSNELGGEPAPTVICAEGGGREGGLSGHLHPYNFSWTLSSLFGTEKNFGVGESQYFQWQWDKYESVPRHGGNSAITDGKKRIPSKALKWKSRSRRCRQLPTSPPKFVTRMTGFGRRSTLPRQPSQ